MKTVVISLAALAVSASAAYADCTAPVGRYAGGTAGLSYDGSTLQPAEAVNIQYLANFKANGSGTVDVTLPNTGQKVTLSVSARGTAGHTWSPTTCSGKITLSTLGYSAPFAYVVVSSGNEIILNDARTGTQETIYPNTVSLKKQ